MTLAPRTRRALALFVLAVLVRLAHLLVVAPTPMAVYHREFRDSDMQLIDQWAQRVAGGDLLGRVPYQPVAAWQLLIGPESAWREWYGGPLTFYKAPFYAYLLGTLRALWGDPMLPAAFLQILASGLAVVLLDRLGARLLGEAAGLWAALLFALHAPAIHFDVVLLRGPWIVLFALAASLALARHRDDPSLRSAALVGAATGLALLTHEGMSPVPMLILLSFLAGWGWSRRTALSAAGFALGFVPMLAPVVTRNVIVGAAPLRLAATGSTVLAVFNGAHANPYAFDVRPAPVAALIAQGHGGTLATLAAGLRSFATPFDAGVFYLRKLSGLAIPFENPDNANFYYATVVDPLLAWLPAYGTVFALAVIGLVRLGRRARTLVPLLPVALTVLASILMTMPLSRYRVTLTVFLCVPAGHAVAQLVAALRARRWRSAVLAAGAMAGILAASAALERAVLGPEAEAAARRYRPAEFFIGADVYARRGRYDRALAQIRELVRRNPSPPVQASAGLFAARLELGRGNAAGARDGLRRAANAAVADPGVLMAIGDIERDELRDPGAALASYRRALAAAPSAALAEALQARLASVEGPMTMR